MRLKKYRNIRKFFHLSILFVPFGLSSTKFVVALLQTVGFGVLSVSAFFFN
jgi:hypothetical protein